jgi:hypothetical protein
VIGRWQADREFDFPNGEKGRSTHGLVARDVRLVLGDRIVPLKRFDRSMVAALDVGSTGGLTGEGIGTDF